MFCVGFASVKKPFCSDYNLCLLPPLHNSIAEETSWLTTTLNGGLSNEKLSTNYNNKGYYAIILFVILRLGLEYL